MFENHLNRFGSAGFAARSDFVRAGLLSTTDDKLVLGFDDNASLSFGGQGGIITCAGPRVGKFVTSQAYTLLGIGYQGNIVMLDPKGEGACVSSNQCLTGKNIVHWNPLGLHGLMQDRINPVGHIRDNSPTVTLDMKTTMETMMPPSGAANGEYFERRGRMWAGAIGLTVTERDGELTMREWLRAVQLLIQGGDPWLEFAYLMHTSRHESVRDVEADIAANIGGEGGGVRGILGEISKAFDVFSDDVLLKAVSPPFSFSFEELLSQSARYNVHLIVPSEFLSLWAVPLRMMFASAMVFKTRAPSAPKQLWMVDEAGQLGANPMLVAMFTIGAGQNIQPWAIFQSFDQMNKLAKDARNILLSSAGALQVFGVRDIETAKFVSDYCGEETLLYHDEHKKLSAAQRKHDAALALLKGEDFLRHALTMRNAKQQAREPSVKHRKLRTPDEVLNTPSDLQYIFCDHVDKTILCHRKRYFDQRFTAGRYLPNPLHPPMDKVQIATRRGPQWRRIIEIDPPQKFRHLRQYQTRPLQYVEGFAP